IISSRTAELDERLWTMNLASMKTNPHFKEIVLKACHRVLLSKLDYFKSGNAAPLYPEISRLKDLIPDREGQKFFLSQACRSITLYKRGSLPYKRAAGEKVLIAGQNQFPELFEEAKKRLGDYAQFKFDYELGPIQADWMSNNIEAMAPGYDTIIICVANERSAMIAKRLAKSGKRVIILSVLTPVPVLRDFDFADTILFGYSYSPYTFKALFAALCGDFEPKGKVPLDLN
nr:glycoside hydrolase family 3 protein [Treponema sp.]